MFETEELEIWNLTPGTSNYAGAQEIFNIVGRLKSPEKTSNLHYSLNGETDKPVFFNRGPAQIGRLPKPGDFNLDTIRLADLKPYNEITFRVTSDNQEVKESKIAFAINLYKEHKPRFQLNFKEIEHASQVGQIVDGKWQLGYNSNGEPCLEIREENAGLDRIILFGRHDWTSGYEITTTLCVTTWIKRPYNVGLLFKWNPHLQGDGSSLPIQWSTGLGYYCSYNPGLRIRFGVNVHLDENGNKVGSFVLKNGRLSLWRAMIGNVVERRVIRRIAREIFGLKLPFTEIAPGIPYHFRLRIHPKKYTLSVWKYGKKEPPPQLVVSKPNERLPKGSMGIVAHYCAVKVYNFNVSPVA
jgi:hypothetical protein